MSEKKRSILWKISAEDNCLKTITEKLFLRLKFRFVIWVSNWLLLLGHSSEYRLFIRPYYLVFVLCKFTSFNNLLCFFFVVICFFACLFFLTCTHNLFHLCERVNCECWGRANFTFLPPREFF